MLLSASNSLRRSSSSAMGYEDTSQFSREHKPLFGVSPMRDVGRLRNAARVSAGS